MHLDSERQKTKDVSSTFRKKLLTLTRSDIVSIDTISTFVPNGKQPVMRRLNKSYYMIWVSSDVHVSMKIVLSAKKESELQVGARWISAWAVLSNARCSTLNTQIGSTLQLEFDMNQSFFLL